MIEHMRIELIPCPNTCITKLLSAQLVDLIQRELRLFFWVHKKIQAKPSGTSKHHLQAVRYHESLPSASKRKSWRSMRYTRAVWKAETDQEGLPHSCEWTIQHRGSSGLVFLKNHKSKGHYLYHYGHRHRLLRGIHNAHLKIGRHLQAFGGRVDFPSWYIHHTPSRRWV